MILWYTIVTIVVALAAGVLCVVLGLAGRRPGDVSVGALVLLELLLIAQLVISIVAPLLGDTTHGNVLEFWVYLVSIVLVPPAGVVWGFAERTRWSTVIMGVAALAAAVMMWRMHMIWTG